MHLFIEDYLNDYIASQDFGYAMMLTGEWGSGDWEDEGRHVKLVSLEWVTDGLSYRLSHPSPA